LLNREFALAISHSVGETMPHVYRITKSPDLGDIVQSVDDLRAFAREHGPGRYNVDEHSLDPFPGTNVTARAWGKVIHHKDGQVIPDPIPW
jgi:hypothetical protein